MGFVYYFLIHLNLNFLKSIFHGVHLTAHQSAPAHWLLNPAIETHRRPYWFSVLGLPSLKVLLCKMTPNCQFFFALAEKRIGHQFAPTVNAFVTTSRRRRSVSSPLPDSLKPNDNHQRGDGTDAFGKEAVSKNGSYGEKGACVKRCNDDKWLCGREGVNLGPLKQRPAISLPLRRSRRPWGIFRNPPPAKHKVCSQHIPPVLRLPEMRDKPRSGSPINSRLTLHAS